MPRFGYLPASFSALAFLTVTSAAAQVAVLPSRTLPAPAEPRIEGFGAWVAAVSDVDANGELDLVVAAPFTNGLAYLSGSAFLVLSTGVIRGTVSTPQPRREGRFGSAAAFLGDLNGDNRRDAVIGAPGESQFPGPVSEPGGDGRAYLVAGGSGVVLFELVSPTPAARRGRFGASVAGPGDLTGDGVPDAVVSAPYEDGGAFQSGKAYVFSGADGALAQTLVSPTPRDNGQFGWRLEPVGDLDGDSVRDLLIAAPGEATPTGLPGRVHVFSGATGTWLRAFDTTDPRSIQRFGDALADIGDADGDGVPDVAVGAPNAGTNGTVTVFSGATGAILLSIAPALDRPIDAQFGSAVAPVADIDGDGVPDLLVGSPFEHTGGTTGERNGRVHLYSGATGAELLVFTTPNPSVYFYGQFGRSVAWADIDQDGTPDPIIGAPLERPHDNSFSTGRVYLYTQASLREAAFPVATRPEPAAALRLGLPTPNPARDAVQLTVTLAEAGPVQLAIHDVLGRTVRTLATGHHAAGPHPYTVDVSGFAPGRYVVRLLADGQAATRPLTVVP